ARLVLRPPELFARVGRLFAARFPARLPVRGENRVAGDRRGDRLAGVVVAADDDQVPFAPLRELALDRRHPDPLRAAVRSGPVEQDARVADIPRAVVPLAPFVLDAEVIVAIRGRGGEIAVAVPRDADHPVFDREEPLGILVPGPLHPANETGEVLAVER